MQSNRIRIGSRESRLAVLQTRLILDTLQKNYPEIQFELITMKTTGDRILDKSLAQIGGKGLFVKELDAALEAGQIDLAIHSLKDLPMEENPDLPVVALSAREDPRDALVLPQETGAPFSEKPLGTSSARRKLQLLSLFPETNCVSVRGNVLTRLQKLDHGEFSALVLAAAGLKRLGLEHRISRYFSTKEMIPAAGQGILAIQGRRGESHPFLKEVHSPLSQAAAQAERTFVRTLNGGCTSPIAAYGEIQGTELRLTGLYVEDASADYRIKQITGPMEQAAFLGEALARQMQKEER